ncbi:MAG: hypothetical protein AAGF12_33550 [Myxococcota bacterium]
MFLRKAAIRPIPRYAVVETAALDSVDQLLGDEEHDLQSTLDQGYNEFERRQPALSRYLADEIARRHDELAQSLGYFLAVTIYLSFREAFPTRLNEIDDRELQLALDTLATDEALRENDPLEVLESDDVIALRQPAVLDYVQHHVHEALEQAGDETDVADLDRVYRSILVEVIALSHAVDAPPHERERAANDLS